MARTAALQVGWLLWWGRVGWWVAVQGRGEGLVGRVDWWAGMGRLVGTFIKPKRVCV